MNKLVAVLFFCLASSASWSADRVSFLLGSFHADRSYTFNEVNPGLFLTWENRRFFDFSVGAYLNSFDRGSVAVSAYVPIIEGDDYSIGPFAALAWYPGNGDNFAVSLGDVVVLGGAQARYKNTFVQVTPPAPGFGSVIAAGLTYEVNK